MSDILSNLFPKDIETLVLKYLTMTPFQITYLNKNYPSISIVDLEKINHVSFDAAIGLILFQNRINQIVCKDPQEENFYLTSIFSITRKCWKNVDI